MDHPYLYIGYKTNLNKKLNLANFIRSFVVSILRLLIVIFKYRYFKMRFNRFLFPLITKCYNTENI